MNFKKSLNISKTLFILYVKVYIKKIANNS